MLKTRTRIGAAIVTTALIVIGLVTSAVPAQADAPVTVTTTPSNDPFYAVPPGISDSAPGTILDVRQVSLPVTSGVLDASAVYQVLYRTVDNHNQPTATVTTVFIPTAAWTGSQPRPLLSYQTAEDGLETTCAPSYLFDSGSVSATADGVILTAALARGWIVSMPDYEGPNSEFLGAFGESREVLDGVRAALQFAPTGLNASSPVGIWGYSGGGYATDLAAQLQSSYAPTLNIQAIATGGMMADINGSVSELSGSVYSAGLLYFVGALERSYPEADVSQYVTATAQQQITTASQKCLTTVFLSGPFFTPVTSFEAYPGSLTSGAVYQLALQASPIDFPGVPQAPVYDYHAILDEATPIAPDRQVMLNYCAEGVTVTHIELLAEHNTAAVVGLPGVLLFLDQRFAGQTVATNCASIPHGSD
ncbi:MAG TPA: lipase family protein [Galbitalea sp.]|jgi:hypothetical protein|nr:lipase family protein [Galbitalea sp.]